jgi:hypothetical protein
MGQSESSIALSEGQKKCQPLQDLFQQCADKYEAEQKLKNGGRDGYQNLGGFAAGPCQILFDDYNDCIKDHMEQFVKSLKIKRK